MVAALCGLAGTWILYGGNRNRRAAGGQGLAPLSA